MVSRPRGHGQQNLQGPFKPYPPGPTENTLNGIVTGSGPPPAGSGVNTQIYIDTATNEVWINQGGTWVKATTGLGIWAPTVGTPGRKPFNGEVLFDIPISYNVTLPVGLTGSVGNCEAAANVDAVFNIYKTGTLIGNVKFPAGLGGNNVAVFTMSSAQAFTAPTDSFSCVSPSPQDSTLSGMSIQFLGSKV